MHTDRQTDRQTHTHTHLHTDTHTHDPAGNVINLSKFSCSKNVYRL